MSSTMRSRRLQHTGEPGHAEAGKSTIAKHFPRVHFIGVGGTGMSGIAEVMCTLGYEVSGSDMADSAVTRRLARLGVVAQRVGAVAGLVVVAGQQRGKLGSLGHGRGALRLGLQRLRGGQVDGVPQTPDQRLIGRVADQGMAELIAQVGSDGVLQQPGGFQVRQPAAQIGRRIGHGKARSVWSRPPGVKSAA